MKANFVTIVLGLGGVHLWSHGSCQLSFGATTSWQKYHWKYIYKHFY